MVLNGSILEYEGNLDIQGEDITSGGIDAEAIMLLINFMDFLWTNYYAQQHNLRLSGGSPKRPRQDLALRKANSETSVITITPEMLETFLNRYGQSTLDQLVRAGRATYGAGARTVGFVRDLLRYEAEPNPPQTMVPYRPPNKTVTPPGNSTNYEKPMASSGKQMLEWKNTLTRMYHTYTRFSMSAVKNAAAVSSLQVHTTAEGEGPCLYWTAVLTPGTTTRDKNLYQAFGWDGGMAGSPTEAAVGPPIVYRRNFRLGYSGTIYVFAADWPGKIMNPDPNTHTAAASDGKYLSMEDFGYNQPTTNKNIPRKWIDVFANVNWNYITVYGTRWVMDFTNFSPVDYTVEIVLFKFAADVDAMDYERQCLAAFGGSQGGTANYMNNLPLSINNDVKIIQKKRFTINGLNQTVVANNVLIAVQNDTANKKRIKMNIMRQYVIKRPDLKDYETTLTEKDIWTKYHEDQSGLYFRVMAWPSAQPIFFSGSTGVVDVFGNNNACMPEVTGGYPANFKITPGVACTLYKKSYFKMDENMTTF